VLRIALWQVEVFAHVSNRGAARASDMDDMRPHLAYTLVVRIAPCSQPWGSMDGDANQELANFSVHKAYPTWGLDASQL